MKILHVITAASVLTISAFANAETSLSQMEMDGVNAAGFSFADAHAHALGVVNLTFTNTETNVLAIDVHLGQFGAIFEIAADSLAEASSDSDATAIGLATAMGNTVGNELSDTTSEAYTATDTESFFGSSMSYATNTSLASSMIRGVTAAANSWSSAAASLANPIAP